MTRTILEWVDRKFDELEYDDKGLYIAKAAGLGVIEGLVDVSFIIGIPATILAVVKTLRGYKD